MDSLQDIQLDRLEGANLLSIKLIYQLIFNLQMFESTVPNIQCCIY